MKKNISVKFGFYFMDKNEVISTATNIKHFPPKQLKNIKPKIYSVLKGLESENILKAKDIILKIGKFKIKNVYDVFKARTKLKWNSTVNFEVKRNRQVLNYQLKIKSFNNWKKKQSRIGIHVEKKAGNIVVSSIDMMSSALPEFLSDPTLKAGDQLVSINGKNINKLEDFFLSIQDMVPGITVNFTFLRDNSLMEKDIRIISFNEFIKLNRKFCKQYWPKSVSRLLVKEYEDNDFYLNQKYKQKILRPAWDLKSVNKALGAAKVASKKGTYKFKSD
tara:strand:+ start:62 stop:889 length:828 start_codon:yes stop_codon:yes gene_type:complete